MFKELTGSTNGQYLMNEPQDRETHPDALTLHLIFFLILGTNTTILKNIM